MRLVNIDDCNRELFYKQMGGKDSLITVESAFDMIMMLPVVTDNKMYNEALTDFVKEFKDYVYHEKSNGNEPYWSVAIDHVKNKLTR